MFCGTSSLLEQEAQPRQTRSGCESRLLLCLHQQAPIQWQAPAFGTHYIGLFATVGPLKQSRAERNFNRLCL
jgi:hypothetical protein